MVPWQLGGLVDECPWVQQVATEESDLGLEREGHLDRWQNSDSEQPGEPASGSAGPVVVVDEEVEEYQDEQQWSTPTRTGPTRKRGRLPVPGRTKLKARSSLADILSASPVEIAELLIKTPFESHGRGFVALHVETPPFTRRLQPAPLIDQLNDALGGCCADVELDQSTGRAHGIVQLRHLEVAQRGSSLAATSGQSHYSERTKRRRTHFYG